jgi:hypothetical protein
MPTATENESDYYKAKAVSGSGAHQLLSDIELYNKHRSTRTRTIKRVGIVNYCMSRIMVKLLLVLEQNVICDSELSPPTPPHSFMESIFFKSVTHQSISLQTSHAQHSNNGKDGFNVLAIARSIGH